MVSIRSYRPGDFDICRRDLWVQLTEYHREIYNAPGIGGDDPGSDFDAHLSLVGPDRLWVAVVEDQVVGLTGLIVTDETSEIEPVIIDANHRGRGIGTALVDHLKTFVAQHGLPELSVRPVGRNTRMLEFMKAQGFNTIGHIELICRDESSKTEWLDKADVSGIRFQV